ncbi:sigma-54-dependent Fis family transcriptional regulator (plasmid) [Azospirillum argentinense]|uniref:Sigma-54-dependent Fis family transcriptional regulator n=1 Tax=Azospirillum argentinense TaxID=2970906 RepID=A0A4D8PNY5_9PROT|nr:sigma-54 dependent transcriptional regulator [Azospirillum argentinense]QCN97398.1 sigma-54-dependent Fis family transcriptional regulator [Azospirillum argentinense]
MVEALTAVSRQRVLLVEDTTPLARLYEQYMAALPFDVQHVETGADAVATLRDQPPEIIVLDLKLPDMDGLEVLRAIRDHDPSIAVVIITANGSVGTAVDAMRAGAFDFLVKPFSADRLSVTLRNAAERNKLGRIVREFRRDLGRDQFHGFVGACDEMQAVYRVIETVASSKASVFITGESGTGKELAAEAIHRSGPRRSGPFVTLNCAAIPKDLLESEIFGHVKGAFTGATADRAGAAQQANGGTLFLDEIGEMPYDLQAKLLRFLQTGMVQPVGAARTEKVDVRFVAATNRDPLIEVQAGRFREDLYYRLYVVPIHLPPLRERGDDVLLIARHILAELSAEEGRRFSALSPGVEAVFRSYDWPGNVRQLINVLRNVVVLHDGETMTADMLPPPLNNVRPSLAPASPPPTHAEGSPETAPAAVTDHDDGLRPLWQVEKDLIMRALARFDNDVPKAATLLEISPSTIYRKLQLWKADMPGA